MRHGVPTRPVTLQWLRLFVLAIAAWVGSAGTFGGYLQQGCRAQEGALPNPFEFLSAAPSLAAEQPLAAEPPQPLDATSDNAEATSDNAVEENRTIEDRPSVQGAQGEGAQDAIDGNRDDNALPVREDNPPGAAVPHVDPVLTKNFDEALLIDLEGPIFDRFHWYLNNRLDLAQREEVDLIIIRLTSPGGDLENSLQLARRLRDIDWATTVVYVPEEAISGGAIVALGCDRIYMQQRSLIGDAGPIQMGLGHLEHAEEKAVSYTASAVRELASAKNRPAALAEAMVDRSLVVYEATDLATGQKSYLSEQELDVPGVAAKFQVGKPLSEAGQNRFLTVGAARALELGLCEGVFASEEELLERLSIATLKSTRMTWIDKTAFLLNRPWLTALLLIVGLISLYMELAAPGISVAGLISLFCFGVFFWSRALGGTAGWLEVLLFSLGVVCLLLELFVLPGFGVFGVSGIGLVILALVMASHDFIVPSNASEWGQMRGNLLIVLGSVLGVLILFFGQILLLDSIPGLNRFRLDAPVEFDNAMAAPLTTLTKTAIGDSGPTIGEEGIAESDLRPSGKVRCGDRLFDVITEGDYVPAGSGIEVLHVEGNRIIVRKVAGN